MTHIDFVLWVALWTWQGSYSTDNIRSWLCVAIAIIGGIFLWRAA